MKAKVLSFPLGISVFLLAILNSFKVFSGNNTIFGLSEYASNAIIFFVALVSIVTLLILGNFVKIKPKSLNLQKNSTSITFSIISLFVAVSIAVNSVFRLMDYLFVYRNIIQLVLSLFGILSCATFILISCGTFKNVNIFKNKEFLTLFPVFWCIIRLYERYTVYSATSNYPWEMADEILVILTLLFLLYQAKFFANIASKNKFKNIVIYGYSYIIFFTAAFTSYAKASSNIEFSNNLIDLCMLMFIGFFISIYKSNLSENNVTARDILETDENDDAKGVKDIKDVKNVKEETAAEAESTAHATVKINRT